MKNQALFSSKDKSEKLKHLLLQFVFGALGVNCTFQSLISQTIAIFSGTRKFTLR